MSDRYENLFQRRGYILSAIRCREMEKRRRWIFSKKEVTFLTLLFCRKGRKRVLELLPREGDTWFLFPFIKQQKAESY